MVDAIGGMSQLAHRTGIERLTSMSAVPNTALALVTELFRDWKSRSPTRRAKVIKNGTYRKRRNSPQASDPPGEHRFFPFVAEGSPIRTRRAPLAQKATA